MLRLNPGASWDDQGMMRPNERPARRKRRQERVMARLRETQVGARAAPVLASELAEILRLIKSLFDPYRPERHYMRGPGPKWHARHGRPAAEAHPAPGLYHVEA